MSLERDENIDRLLHDAEHKDSAATFARTLMHQPDKAAEFERERDALIAEAHQDDPWHTAPAWRETLLSLPDPSSAARPPQSEGPAA